MKPLSRLQSLLVRTGASLSSGAGERASLVILIFHQVLRERDPLMPDEPDAATFSSIVELLARHFNPLRLRDAVKHVASGTLPPRSVCITFDDGYANNREVALPILAAHKVPATVFVSPGFLNGGRMFNDTIIEAVRHAPSSFDLSDLELGSYALGDFGARVNAAEDIIRKVKHWSFEQRSAAAQEIARRCTSALPANLMMTDAQVRELHDAGIEIGAHTMTHPILTRIDASRAAKEIADSKAYLESLLKAPVTSFAYPNGRPVQDYDATHVDIVRRAGFDLALSTAWGAMTARSDRFQIPRLAPWDATAFRYAVRMMRGYSQRQYTTV